MQELSIQLRLPDPWQQQAIEALQAGRDVVVDAPTGAGKTYIFELLIEQGWQGQAIYTVPTRALANDKVLEWRRRLWNVGIATGDISENLGAPVVVATLETQKWRLLHGHGPRLLVIDEYQMLSDDDRGMNYEMAIALAPPDTQLLLLSGSVGNPQIVVDWLTRLQRKATLVRTKDRPVPLDEIHLEALHERIPERVRGTWPRAIAKALKAEMGPLLVFAPRRKAAETLARQLAAALPEEDPLVLTPEQRLLAGDTLTRLLKSRIAYHHSGLDYRQRAGLVEPLAKAGQLRVVVATMGLSSGVNFNLRSVLVSDREYRAHDHYHLVLPHELLQMFGRAGRRGLDKRGYILVAPGKPRLSEARPLVLKRTHRLEWPALLAVMHTAVQAGGSPRQAALDLAGRLLSPRGEHLGFDYFEARQRPLTGSAERPSVVRQTVQEILNSDGQWERRKAPVRVSLSNALTFEGGQWRPALSVPRVLEQVGTGLGVVCRLSDPPDARYGREIPLARLGRATLGEGELVLTRWLQRQLLDRAPQTARFSRRKWTLDRLESEIIPLLPLLCQGGRFRHLVEKKDHIGARLDFDEVETFGLVDSRGQALLDPPQRETEHVVHLQFLSPAEGSGARRDLTPAEAWYELGLVDEELRPIRRGVLMSFFNHGEGLAIAAALEDNAYDLHQLIFDLANLRAGHRFSGREEGGGRLGNVCRMACKGATYPGYLNKGVPIDYGDGAAEVVASLAANPHNRRIFTSEDLSGGDIERAQVEWRSLLQHISRAPAYDWDRWLELRSLVQKFVEGLPPRPGLGEFPPLTPVQLQRHKSFLRFD